MDGLVVSCTDAPKGDKDLIREKLVNMAYFSKLGVGYSHTCSEMEAVALSAERDGLDLLPQDLRLTKFRLGCHDLRSSSSRMQLVRNAQCPCC